MPSSTPNPIFLIDENVKKKLFLFLQQKNIDVKHAPKATSDHHLAALSYIEKRILITNDEDFTQYPDNSIYSVILLRIPQNDTDALIQSFTKLLKDIQKFSGKLIILEKNKWHDFPLAQKINL